MANACVQAYTLERIPWREEASPFPSLKQTLEQAGLEGDKEAFSLFLQPENCGDRKTLRTLLSISLLKQPSGK